MSCVPFFSTLFDTLASVHASLSIVDLSVDSYKGEHSCLFIQSCTSIVSYSSINEYSNTDMHEILVYAGINLHENPIHV